MENLAEVGWTIYNVLLDFTGGGRMRGFEIAPDGLFIWMWVKMEDLGDHRC